MEEEQFYEAQQIGGATAGGGNVAENLAGASTAPAAPAAPGGSNTATPPSTGPTVEIGMLAELLRQLGRTAQPAPTPRFKLPEYSGDSDVEVFVSTFLGIMDASAWPPSVALLHLRSCLRGEARDSAVGDNILQALEALKNRFGLTAAQARDRLAVLRHEGKQSLHALGSEVEKLVGVAYQSMPVQHQRVLAVEAFKRALNNRPLQQHLLAVPATSVQELVVAAEAYLQVGSPVVTTPFRPRPQVAAVSSFATESTAEAAPANDELAGLLKQLIKSVESNSKAIAQLSSSQAQPSQANRSSATVASNGGSSGGYRGQPGPCFRCGGPHLKKDCKKPAGNADRPQQ